jgi:uncharacterized protein YjbJ (UPF0337 family)
MSNDSGPANAAEGALEGLKGKAKEVAGTVTGNDSLQDEGSAQQEKAAAQREVARKEAEAEAERTKADVKEAEQSAHENR